MFEKSEYMHVERKADVENPSAFIAHLMGEI